MDESPGAAARDPSPAKTQEDLLAARREARRRKILENSTNRLSKIVGHELPTTPAAGAGEAAASSTGSVDANSASERPNARTAPAWEPSGMIYPDPEDERMEFENPLGTGPLSAGGMDFAGINGLGGAGQNGDILQLLNSITQAQAGSGMVGASMDPSTMAGPAGPPPRSNSRFAKVLRTKIHLIVASIVVYLLFATGNEAYIGGNVFLPLLAWELLEILTIGASEAGTGGQQLLGIVFLLGGIPMKTSQTVMKLLHTVNKVLKDVAFFMFFFVLTHLLWSRLWLGIELRYVLGYDQLEPGAAGSTIVGDSVTSS